MSTTTANLSKLKSKGLLVVGPQCNKDHRYLANFPKLVAIDVFQDALFMMPIIVIFFQKYGLSLSEIMLLQSIFSIAIVILEVPSGYVADRLGRKKTIAAGIFLIMLGWLNYCFASSFSTFLISQIILAFGVSFISGADTALLYDSLISLKTVDEYAKKEGQINAASSTSEGLAAIIGGFVATISLRIPFYFQTFFSFIALCVSLTLTEPPIHKSEKNESEPQSILKIVKYSLHGHREVKWLIVYSSLLQASTLVMVWFTQPYFNNAGLPLQYFGILWAFLNIAVAAFSLLPKKVEKTFETKKILVLLPVLIAAGYFLVAGLNSLWAIPFFLLFYFVRGAGFPILTGYINHIIPSNVRATVLSVRNLVYRLSFAIIGPIIGFISDKFSMQIALYAAGAFFMFSCLFSLVFLRKYKAV